MEKWYFCGMKSFFVTLFVAFFAAILALLLTACRGDDRSGEQPFAPTVVTAPVSVEGGTVTMRGVVTASPNSSLIRCGFYYGNDTIDCDTLLPEAAYDFTAVFRNLAAGDYYTFAFAVNGIGVSYGDTVRFTIP